MNRLLDTMRAVILERLGVLSVQPVPVPSPGPGDVLVKVVAATTCGTDLKAYVRGHPLIPMPGGLGHEYSGIVAAVGEGARFEVGQAVMGVHSAPCQTCYWCLHDQENLCETITSTLALGSFAEYLLIPARVARLNMFEKPESISFEKASLLEPLACVAQGVQLLNVPPDAKVLVIGPGAIGLMFVAALRLSRVADVTLAGRNGSRLAVGASLGAATVKFEGLTPEGRGFDIVVECTGQVEVWEKSVDFARRGGTVMLFGGPAGGTRAGFDTHRLHYDQISLLSPFHFGTSAVRQARDWLLDPSLDLSALIAGDCRLEEVGQVFEDLRAGKGIKYVVRPTVDPE